MQITSSCAAFNGGKLHPISSKEKYEKNNSKTW